MTVDVSIPTGVNVVTPTSFYKGTTSMSPVRFAPLPSNVAGNLASGIVPDVSQMRLGLLSLHH